MKALVNFFGIEMSAGPSFWTRMGIKTSFGIGIGTSAVLWSLGSFAQLAPNATPYEKIEAFVAQVAQTHPETTKTIVIGDSDSGRPIVGLKIGNGPLKNLVVATHHGNEYGSTEVAKAVAESLAAQPIEGQTIYVIPVLNIGGYNRGRREESANGRNWDPNRNYPGPCATEGPFTLKSTKALADFVDREGIVSSATLHTAYPAVLYPWGISSRDLTTAYDAIFIKLAELATAVSGYEFGNSTEVLYAADGTFEDYAYWKHGIWSLLYELGESMSPSQSQIAEMIRVNVPGIRETLVQSQPARAVDHSFTGRCDVFANSLDRHDE